MPKAIVQIQRGRFSPRFQVARAWLSAASACASNPDRPTEAVEFIDRAILELRGLRLAIKAGAPR